MVFKKTESVQRQILDVSTSRPSPSLLAERRRDIEDRIEKSKANLTKDVSKYNSLYPIRNSNLLHEKRLKVDYDNPAATIKQIEDIANSIYPNLANGILTPLSQVAGSSHQKRQLAVLQAFHTAFTEYSKLHASYQLIDSQASASSRHNLSEKTTRLQQMKEAKLSIEKKPAYKKLLNDYRQVFHGLMGRDENFKRYYSRVDFRNNLIVDSRLSRENQQLFFSILAEETKNFGTDFVLQKMTKDPKKNKELYPFIYQKWRAKQIGGDKLKGDQTKLDGLSKIAGAKPDQVIGKVAELTTETNQSLRHLRIPSIKHLVNPFTDIGFDKPTTRDELQTVKKKLSEFIQQVRELKAYVEKYMPNAERTVTALLNETDKQLGKYYKVIQAQETVIITQDRQEQIDKGFTLENLSKESMRQIVLEYTMLKYQEAMRIVDQPLNFGGSMHRFYQPATRRLLIAMIYREGVRDPKNSKQNIGNQYTWMLPLLAQSKLFNRSPKNKFVSKEQKQLLFVSRFANLALFKANYLKDTIISGLTDIQEDIKKRNNYATLPSNPINNKRVQLLQNKIAASIAAMNQKLGYANLVNPLSENNLSTILNNERARLKAWNEFVKRVELFMVFTSNPKEALKNPKYKEYLSHIPANLRNFNGELSESNMNAIRQWIKGFVDEVKTGRTLSGLNTKAKEVNAFTEYIDNVDTNYNSLNLREKSVTNLLDKYGIRTEGFHSAYILYLKDNPDVHVDNWQEMAANPEKAKKLIIMFEQLLPPSPLQGKTPEDRTKELSKMSLKDRQAYQAKEDFLNGIRNYHKLKLNKNITNDQQSTLTILTLLQANIRQNESLNGLSGDRYKKAKEHLDGSTFGDKITDYGRSVINMLIGPGQSVANRAAGLIAIVAAWKLAKYAISGTGRTSTMLKFAFMAGAAELIVKKTTGHGFLDRAQITGTADALRGTKAGVLIDNGDGKLPNIDYKDTKNEKITPVEHASMLTAMRHTSFRKLMSWYENTDSTGKPRKNDKGNSKAKLPINPEDVITGTVTDNPESRVRLILRYTLFNFFRTVGAKNDVSDLDGQKILKQSWVSPFSDKNIDTRDLRRRGLPGLLIEKIRENPDRLTWEFVLNNEITPAAVRRTNAKYTLNQGIDYFKSAGQSIQRWSRRNLEQKLGTTAEQFKNDFSGRYYPDMMRWLGEMGEKGATNFRYYKRSVYFKYKEHEYKIRKLGSDSLELIGNGFKLPFELFYVVHQKMVPFINTKFRQTREIFRNDLTILPHNRPFRSNDIIGNVARGSIDGKTPTQAAEILKNVRTNPRFKAFGVHQIPFYKAMQKAGAYPKLYTTETPARSASAMDKLQGAPGIGYLITEVDSKSSGAKPNYSKEQTLGAMTAASRKQAIDTYSNIGENGIDRKTVAKLIEPIHIAIQGASEDGNMPPKMYTFWRMPLPSSTEFKLKTMGRWPDYLSGIKDRQPYNPDPKKTTWQNLSDAYGLNSPVIHKGTELVSLGLSQWLRAMLAVVETGGAISKGTLRLLSKARKLNIKPEHGDWIDLISRRDEKQLQMVDESLLSAGRPSLSLSRFYRNKTNAKNFRDALKLYQKGRTNKIDLKINQETGQPWVWKGVKYKNYHKRQSTNSWKYKVETTPTKPYSQVED